MLWLSSTYLLTKIVKPERSRHCEICDSCISVYDHHCPWIANCVGANNYWAFFTFLISMFLFMVFTIAFEIVSKHILNLDLVDTQWNNYHALHIIRIICEFLSLLIALLFILPLTYHNRLFQFFDRRSIEEYFPEQNYFWEIWISKNIFTGPIS